MSHRHNPKTIFPLIALLVAVFGCVYALNRVPSIPIGQEPKGYYFSGSVWANVMPVMWKDAPAEFKVTRDDYKQYPRENFAFHFETARGFIVDTFVGIVGKDMGSVGDTTVALKLPKDTIDKIYKTALAIRFFEMPEPCPPYGCYEFDGHSEGLVKMTIRSGDTLKTISWDAGRNYCGPHSDQWARLYHIAEMMRWAGLTSEEYIALPRSRACYI